MMENKSLWWQNYRKRLYKPRKYLSVEMIIRKSFLQALKEYAKNSSIAGWKDIWYRDIEWKQRVIRLLIFLIMMSTLFYILYYTWFGTLSKPLIVTMESSTYPISRIDFPAVAVCNINRISKELLNKVVLYFYSQIAKNESLEEIEKLCLEFGRLIDCSYDASANNNERMREAARKHYNSRSVIELMKAMAPKCNEMLLKCSWAGEIVNCSSIFTVRRTVRGHCCAFNYILDYDSAGRPKSTIAEVKRQPHPGLYQGLMVMLDPMIHDYAYPIYNAKGFDVFIFNPKHFADPSAGHVIHKIIGPNEVKMYKLNSVKQLASPEVRKHPFRTRQCLFHDEMPEKFGNMYSYSACLVNCRMNSMKSLCKCMPYFMPSSNHERICTTDDLHCLNKYKEKLTYIYPVNALETEGLDWEVQDSLYCPECLPDCEITRHNVETSKTSMFIEDIHKNKVFRYKFFQDMNLTDKCFLGVYQHLKDGVLDRLDVVAYWFEVLSNVGGFGGILVGFSIICLIEIFYFLILRFITLIIINYKDYH